MFKKSLKYEELNGGQLELIWRQLEEGINSIEVKIMSGTGYPFKKADDVIRVLNEKLGVNNWKAKVVSEKLTNTSVVIRSELYIFEQMVSEGYGNSDFVKGQESGDLFKSAYKDSIKNACGIMGLDVVPKKRSHPAAGSRQVIQESYNPSFQQQNTQQQYNLPQQIYSQQVQYPDTLEFVDAYCQDTGNQLSGKTANFSMKFYGKLLSQEVQKNHQRIK